MTYSNTIIIILNQIQNDTLAYWYTDVLTHQYTKKIKKCKSQKPHKIRVKRIK